MAKKEESKNVLEREYNVPLRKEYMKAPNWRRTPNAVRALRKFISKHMKSENVVIGKYANLHLWKHGIKNPPHHIKVNAVKDDKGRVTVELAELPARAKRQLDKEKSLKETDKKKEAKEKAETKEKAEKKTETEVKEAQFEEVVEETKKEKEEKGKETLKEEIKELFEEQKKHPMQHAPKKQSEQHFQEQHQSGPRSQ